MRLPLCLRRLEGVAGATRNPSLLALGVLRGRLLLGRWALGLRAGLGSRRYRLRQPCRWGFTVKCALTAGTAAITTAARSTATSTTRAAAADRHWSQRWPRRCLPGRYSHTASSTAPGRCRHTASSTTLQQTAAGQRRPRLLLTSVSLSPNIRLL